MKMLILISSLIVLSACGSVSSYKNSDDTDFVLISQAKAGGVYKLLSGDVRTCKLTDHGVTGLNYSIEFRNGECVVSVQK